MTDSYARQHLDETARIVAALDPGVLDRMAAMLGALMDGRALDITPPGQAALRRMFGISRLD